MSKEPINPTPNPSPNLAKNIIFILTLLLSIVGVVGWGTSFEDGLPSAFGWFSITVSFVGWLAMMWMGLRDRKPN